MANSTGMDILLDGAAGRGLSLEVSAKDTPADVAVRMWLLSPGLLEDLHNYRELTRPRAFRYFATDTDPVPTFVGPTEAQTAALLERLNRFYVAWRRGTGARVFTYKRGDMWAGKGMKEIAADLGISPKTVEYHRERLYRLFGVRDPVSLCRRGLAVGVIHLEEKP
jgi:hypothetical protein